MIESTARAQQVVSLLGSICNRGEYTIQNKLFVYRTVGLTNQMLDDDPGICFGIRNESGTARVHRSNRV